MSIKKFKKQHSTPCCAECGASISKNELQINEGLCSECVQTIK